MLDDDVPYLMRGVRRVPTDSSVLISSSAYLNNLEMREWIAFIMLRMNGADSPPQLEMEELLPILRQCQDAKKIADLFAHERAGNSRLAQWLDGRRLSSYSIDEMKALPPRTLGAIAAERMEGRAPAARPLDPSSDLEFFRSRTEQNAIFDSVLIGAPEGHFGQLLRHYAFLSNLFTHFSPELAGELGTYHLFGILRFLPRTILHHPAAFPAVIECAETGIEMGKRSPPIFLIDYDDVLALPVSLARNKFNIDVARELDFSAAEEAWAGS